MPAIFKKLPGEWGQYGSPIDASVLNTQHPAAESHGVKDRVKCQVWIQNHWSLFLLAEHIASHQSTSFSSSLPGSRLSFALKQSKLQTNIHTSTGAQTHSHNSTLKSGFPIAPAHTKQNVSSDYRYCSLLASGASILNLFSPLPLYSNLIL